MNAVQFERKKDEDALMVLHLTDNEGWTCKAAGARYGMTKNAVLGMRNRIKNTQHCYDGCSNKQNLDFGMTPLWWK